MGLARAKLVIADFHMMDSALPEAATMMEGVRETLAAHGKERTLCRALTVLGSIAIYRGDFAQASDNFAAVAALARLLRDDTVEVLVLVNLSLLEFSRGDIARAIELGREAIASSRRRRLDERLPLALHNLAAYLVAAERMDEARPVAQEALSLLRSLVDSLMVRVSLQVWAMIGVAEGCYTEAARLIGWVDAAYASAGAGRLTGEQQSYERLMTLLRAHFTESELEALAAEGGRWTLEQAVNFAFEHIVR